MEKLKITKETPPKRRGTRYPRNIKYQGVYEAVKASPNEWVKIEPLDAREIASIRQYYTKRRLSVLSRVEGAALYLKWETLTKEMKS